MAHENATPIGYSVERCLAGWRVVQGFSKLLAILPSRDAADDFAAAHRARVPEGSS